MIQLKCYDSPLKLEQTFVDCYPTINVSGFVWCTECETGSSDYIQAYLDTMLVYEEMYPNVHFVYR